MPWRILFIGDIVGRPGVRVVQAAVPVLRDELGLDLVIANAENASGGSGCLPSAYRQLRDAGVDLVTMGDHLLKKQELAAVLEADARICKPANAPPGCPGAEFATCVMADGRVAAAVSLLGRTFMKPADCPFLALDRTLANLAGRAAFIVVDAHAEATGEKYLLAHHARGRVAAVVGTHTHVPTADEQVMPGGTAFLCDVGMTGPHDGILGRRADRVLHTTLTGIPSPFDVATNDVRLNGAVIDIGDDGRATAIRRLCVPEAGVQAIRG